MLKVPAEVVPGFEELGFLAFTTTRQAGSFNLGGTEPAAQVFARWVSLRADLAPYTNRLASSHQVHGTRIVEHAGGWDGWLRAFDADGHVSFEVPTAMAVSLADCVPVFIAHPSGVGAILHAGWRGTAARILEHGIATMSSRGFSPGDLTVHLGPGICGRCYEVGPEVFQALTGTATASPRTVDLRALLAAQATDAGVDRISVSESCTRCHNERFFSHRSGDAGRQLGVLVAGAR